VRNAGRVTIQIMDSLTITRPDDWHIHLRDGTALQHTVADAARYFGRAIVMPNLTPPVLTTADAHAYYERIVRHIPEGRPFRPLMTLYLTDATTPTMIRDAAESPFVTACKLYPAGATTNSDAGVGDLAALDPVFEAMQTHDVPLCLHGEVTDTSVDVFDREAVFIDTFLTDMVERFPKLRVIFEHITTREAVDFVAGAREGVAATITAHHLLYNRNDMLAGSMQPLFYCLPILKRNTHQAALVAAAVSGNPKFFLGTDSAPHPQHAKQRILGCAAGSYTAHAAIELYAAVFDAEQQLDALEGFASEFGPGFYGLDANTDTVTLERISWQIPESLPLADEPLIPIAAGETLAWQVTDA
jgi:dihydroorotase